MLREISAFTIQKVNDSNLVVQCLPGIKKSICENNFTWRLKEQFEEGICLTISLHHPFQKNICDLLSYAQLLTKKRLGIKKPILPKIDWKWKIINFLPAYNIGPFFKHAIQPVFPAIFLV